MKTKILHGPHALLTVRQVSDLLKCSPRRVFRLSRSHRMPSPVKIGALVRWRHETGDPQTGIVDWLQSGCPFVQEMEGVQS